MRPTVFLSAVVTVLGIVFPRGKTDFIYFDFNDTAGLVFNGDSATSSCGGEKFLYQPRHGTADGTGSFPGIITDLGSTVITDEMKTIESEEFARKIENELSSIGHKNIRSSSPDPRGCAVRLRLTASQPNKLGSVWRTVRDPLLSGFETGFTFQISDHSRNCRTVRDPSFMQLYQSCTVHGGDGFAFVIQNDRQRTKTIGKRKGSAMGYGGIRNSIAIEFDTWFNDNTGDMWEDHVSVQVSGPPNFRRPIVDRVEGRPIEDPVTTEFLQNPELTPDATTKVGSAKNTTLGDGKIHLAKIRYFPYLKYDLLDQFTAADPLLPFIKDNGEGRRIGTLVIYVDNMKQPLLAIPINLSVAVELKKGNAYIGFTSSTGSAWERHDITSWYFCEESTCERKGLSDEVLAREFDFGDGFFTPFLRESVR